MEPLKRGDLGMLEGGGGRGLTVMDSTRSLSLLLQILSQGVPFPRYLWHFGTDLIKCPSLIQFSTYPYPPTTTPLPLLLPLVKF